MARRKANKSLPALLVELAKINEELDALESGTWTPPAGSPAARLLEYWESPEHKAKEAALMEKMHTVIANIKW